ncbi:MAG: phytanoyl-CoA dioxygenase family protein [Deltaproteobacteria bacterium]|nr:phytanoyl-CoA dioxygenase family protein [Deltaproteobacteria bacterium]
MNGFGLSTEQINFVRTFGYLRLPGVLAGSIAEIDSEFERVIRLHGGDEYAGEHRFTVSPGINGSDLLCSAILDSERLDGALVSLLGSDYQYWNSELSLCNGDTAWHSDSPWPKERRTPGWYRVLIYLDELREANGALRVIPGTHRADDEFASEIHRGIIDASETVPARPVDTWGVVARELPAVTLSSSPGDVIFLSYLVAHASFGGGARRRLLDVTYFPHLAGDALEQLRTANRDRRHTRQRVFGHRAPLLRTASPRRRLHLEQLLEHTPDDGPSLASILGLL